ncbi:MAG TPA: hypothetical protein VNS31_03770 [Ramlibacter sp.]|jgi:hypothetical protein|nr:hypothetical protein [Ramlibacter sp.]
MRNPLVAIACAGLLAACGSQPPAPDWQSNARGALERFTSAYFQGDARVEAVEFENARTALAATGQPGLVARAELTRCAVAVASLVLDRCDGFEALRADAPAAELAYADYLAGHVTPAEVLLLPDQHRAVASGREDPAAVQTIANPLSRLVAAGVLFRMGRASPQIVAIAVETASQQGWRRPLLAWLGVQAQRAEAGGRREEAERIRRRIELVSGQH